MTAVDHAELKRLAEAAQLHVGGLSRSLSLAIIADNETKGAEIESLKAEKDGWIRWADEKICEAQAESLALLSEIEGLKAAETLLKERIIEAADLFGVPDGGRYLNDWKATAAKYDDLRTQAPDSWRPDRCDVEEAIHAWLRAYMGPVTRGSMTPPVRDALVDAILALRPQTAESGT